MFILCEEKQLPMAEIFKERFPKSIQLLVCMSLLAKSNDGKESHKENDEVPCSIKIEYADHVSKEKYKLPTDHIIYGTNKVVFKDGSVYESPNVKFCD